MRHEKFSIRPRVLGYAIFSIFISLPAWATKSQDQITHDMLCMSSVGVLRASSDEKIRSTAPVVFFYYLGRLTQMGVPPDQIQRGLDNIAWSPYAHPEINQKDFANACANVLNSLLK